MNYYSEILDTHHCVYGFLKRTSALTCREFLVRYRMKHNQYPTIGQAVLADYRGVDDSIVIEEGILEDMKTKCVLNGLHLIGIHTFEFSLADDVKLSGTILTEDETVSKEDVRDNLEYILEL